MMNRRLPGEAARSAERKGGGFCYSLPRSSARSTLGVCGTNILLPLGDYLKSRRSECAACEEEEAAAAACEEEEEEAAAACGWEVRPGRVFAWGLAAGSAVVGGLSQRDRLVRWPQRRSPASPPLTMLCHLPSLGSY